ncbi:unnamed protein product [Ilex paraguariensis]|uniref:F-box domain-containing protein n=1 Tax=Ilex paraguariensis TaxID=185542 RepID=A0ABC8TPX9_9AQUA
MDPGIWSRLPEDILEHVLAFLPLKTLLNLRSTCKHFKSLILSPSFISKHYSSFSSPFSSFVLLSHPQFHYEYPLYDTILNNWRNVSLSLTPVLSNVPSAVLLSTSNGLLCFSLPNSSSFLVCNLLARSSRKVKFPKKPFVFNLLTLVSTSGGYILFMLSPSSSGASYNTLLYDSSVQSWQEFEGFDPVLSNDYHQEGVYNNGYLYFTTTEPFSVVSFGLEFGKWERLMVELPDELMFIRLVSDGNGKLYMIGGIGSDGISRSIKLWELSGGGENWVVVESVPSMMCRKFLSVCYHNYKHVYCFWHQGMICVCCYSWPEILYYRVSKKTWHWLPKCPSLPEKWILGFRWFSFVPELFAFV